MKVLIVDDLRLFDNPDGDDHEYAINSREALLSLAAAPWGFDEIWLDHDLGGVDTIRPVIDWIERDFHEKRRLEKLSAIRILTNNPVGRQKIEALGRYVPIKQAPKHTGLRGKG